jgi:hypothetical protein
VITVGLRRRLPRRSDKRYWPGISPTPPGRPSTRSASSGTTSNAAFGPLLAELTPTPAHSSATTCSCRGVDDRRVRSGARPDPSLRRAHPKAGCGSCDELSDNSSLTCPDVTRCHARRAGIIERHHKDETEPLVDRGREYRPAYCPAARASSSASRGSGLSQGAGRRAQAPRSSTTRPRRSRRAIPTPRLSPDASRVASPSWPGSSAGPRACMCHIITWLKLWRETGIKPGPLGHLQGQ